jgi:hypothetical protein
MAGNNGTRADGIVFAAKVVQTVNPWPQFTDLRSEFIALGTDAARTSALETLRLSDDPDHRSLASALEESLKPPAAPKPAPASRPASPPRYTGSR